MNSIPSPFTNRGVITSPEDFFGRKIEINEVLTRLRTMQSTAVVGERRIGKSSLLYHLYQTGVRRLNNDARFRFLYLDLQDARYHTARGFLHTVLARLAPRLMASSRSTRSTGTSSPSAKPSRRGSQPASASSSCSMSWRPPLNIHKNSPMISSITCAPSSASASSPA